MPVDVGTDSCLLLDSQGVACESLNFGSVARLATSVSLIARVRGRTARNIPLVRPVAVHVGADTFLVIFGAILAPKSIGLDAVDEAWITNVST